MISGATRSAAAALLAMVFAPGLVAASDAERLDRVRAEIEEREERARAFASEAEGYLGELEAIDREMNELRRSISRLRRRRHAAEEELVGARAALASAEGARARVQDQLEVRLVALYKFRSTGGMPALAIRDFQTFSRIGRGLSHVLAQDSRLFSAYRAAEAQLRHSTEQAKGLTAELAVASREISRREDRTRRKLVEHRNVVALLRSRAGREQQAAAELREAASRLEDALRRLPGGPPAGPGLRRGAVRRPTEGPIRLGFGRQVDPEFGTETLRTGVEFGGIRGSPVRAVAGGRVLFAGWFRGYGQMVIIDHGRGHVTVSGYLDDLDVSASDLVNAGQQIGTVGQTGAVSSPGLYFEVRQDGVAVDPGLWLAR